MSEKSVALVTGASSGMAKRSQSNCWPTGSSSTRLPVEWTKQRGD